MKEKRFYYINNEQSCYPDAIRNLPCHCDHPAYTRLYSDGKPPLRVIKECNIKLGLYMGYSAIIECPWCHALASIPISEDIYNEIHK